MAVRIHGIGAITEILDIISIHSQEQVNVPGAGRGRVRDETDVTYWDDFIGIALAGEPAFGVPNVDSRHVVDAIIGPCAARKGRRKADNGSR